MYSILHVFSPTLSLSAESLSFLHVTLHAFKKTRAFYNICMHPYTHRSALYTEMHANRTARFGPFAACFGVRGQEGLLTRGANRHGSGRPGRDIGPARLSRWQGRRAGPQGQGQGRRGQGQGRRGQGSQGSQGAGGRGQGSQGAGAGPQGQGSQGSQGSQPTKRPKASHLSAERLTCRWMWVRVGV